MECQPEISLLINVSGRQNIEGEQDTLISAAEVGKFVICELTPMIPAQKW